VIILHRKTSFSLPATVEGSWQNGGFIQQLSGKKEKKILLISSGFNEAHIIILSG